MNLACAILGALEVIDGKRWLKTLTDIKVKHSIPIITTPIQTAYYLEIALSVCVGLYAILFAYLSYAVVREFGWVIYKKIGADLAIQRKLQTTVHTLLAPLTLLYRDVQNCAAVCAGTQDWHFHRVLGLGILPDSVCTQERLQLVDSLRICCDHYPHAADALFRTSSCKSIRTNEESSSSTCVLTVNRWLVRVLSRLWFLSFSSCV